MLGADAAAGSSLALDHAGAPADIRPPLASGRQAILIPPVRATVQDADIAEIPLIE
jgi:hypothetical protein